MIIDKDTVLYGSFAKQAGNKGCEFFNAAFEKYNINAIYKSFSIDNIATACIAAEALKMGGFAVAMPFKLQVGTYINWTNGNKSVNTVIRKERDESILQFGTEYHGYNTDYVGAKQIINNRCDKNRIYILGKGGLSVSVQQAAKDLGIEQIIITKENWKILDDLKDVCVYNCTPVDLTNHQISKNSNFIDCRIGTPDGDELHKLQSRAQFKLYTGIDYGD